jgi:hypothetical protein
MVQKIILDVDKLEIRSFPTTDEDEGGALADQITSGVSETNGVYRCKSCGPCCQA